MSKPGEYVPDPSEGIAAVEDLPKPKIVRRSRNYRHRRCPRCGHGAYRLRRVERTLHDLGDPASGRPRDIHLTYSKCPNFGEMGKMKKENHLYGGLGRERRALR